MNSSEGQPFRAKTMVAVVKLVIYILWVIGSNPFLNSNKCKHKVFERFTIGKNEKGQNGKFPSLQNLKLLFKMVSGTLKKFETCNEAYHHLNNKWMNANISKSTLAKFREMQNTSVEHFSSLPLIRWWSGKNFFFCKNRSWIKTVFWVLGFILWN